MMKYDYKELELSDNTSTGMILRQVTPGSTVLEFGCAAGRMTKYMKEKLGCSVYIVEYSEEGYRAASAYAVDGVCGDIMDFHWMQAFGDVKFDFLVFADVLEHLRDPEQVLTKARALLKEEGAVLCSIPNAGHGDILLNLYENRFRYSTVGLLDQTHIHLFAYQEIEPMMSRAGYKITNEEAVFMPVYQSEQAQYLADPDHAVYDQILARRSLSDVYQFILKLQTTTYAERYYLKKKSTLDLTPNDAFCEVIPENAADQSQICIPVKVSGDTYYYQYRFQERQKSFYLVPKVRGACLLYGLEVLSNERKAKLTCVNGTKAGNFFCFTHDEPSILVEFSEPEIAVNFRYTLLPVYGELERSFLMQICGEYCARSGGAFDGAEESSEMDSQLAQNLAVFLQTYHNEKNEDADESSGERKISELERYQRELEIYRRRVANYQELCNGYKRALTSVSHPELADVKRWNGQHEKVTQTEKEWVLSGHIWENPFLDVLTPEPVYLDGRKVRMDHVPDSNIAGGSVAVQLHLYYVDLIPEYFNYLNHIPYPFDLYISCQENADIGYIGNWFRKLRMVRAIIVRKAPNRGRDIAPVYVLFAEELEQHDYFLHIHTKKSLYSGTEQMDWRQYALTSLLGTPEQIKKIFSLFHSDRHIGLVFPENNALPIMAQHWLSNVAEGARVLSELQIPFEDTLFNYPVGSFFWARTDAVRKLFQRRFTYEDFPEEQGQTDGTLAHTLERVIAFVNKAAGYENAVVDLSEHVFRLGESFKVYKPYFEQTKESAAQYLSQFDCISFDIFDTLITRKVYRPDDVFRLMAKKIEKEMSISCDFLSVRKAAEHDAWMEYGARTSIQEIYERLSTYLPLTQEQVQRICNMEFETEQRMILPRRDMLWVFNYLKDAGKKIVLVSDMYLTADMITKLLHQCGYSGWSELWLSCEKGCRKDDDTMWTAFFEEHGAEKTIHVGDNFRSDIQCVVDRHKETFSVLSPAMAFSMTEIYKQMKKSYADTVENSLVLGTFVNEYLCNSPFCFTGRENDLKDKEPYEVGLLQFGPLFFAFANWLSNCSSEKLLFLAREGWILQQIYRAYCEASGKTELPSSYFLASRRAASVAAIRDKADVREILAQNYNGTLENLLRTRLGCQTKWMGEVGKLIVNSTEHLDAIMDLLQPIMPQLRMQIEQERSAYLAYAEHQIGTADHIAVVDLGYSGTIQYYLTKLLNRKVSGYYLCTGENVKPKKLNCKCMSMYEKTDMEDTSSDLIEQSLLLEAALQAPYGQLLSFSKDEDGSVEPQYDSKTYYPSDLHRLQDGIIAYVKELAELYRDLPQTAKPDTESIKALYLACCGEHGFERGAALLQVQDDYCSDGRFEFNGQTWVLK